MLRVIHSCGPLMPETGGLAHYIVELCSNLSEDGVDVRMLALDMGDRFSEAQEVNVPLTQVPVKCALGMTPVWTPHYEFELKCMVSNFEPHLIHDHGLWITTKMAAQRVVQQSSLPLVVSTHGMLTPWALRHRFGRKKLAWWLYQKKVLLAASAFHASSSSEAEGIRNLGFDKPIAVIPHAIQLPDLQTISTSRSSSQRTLLFLSRIHPVKGLLNLIAAVESASLVNWQVIIAGPDENGYRTEVERAVENSNLTKQITFHEPVYGQAKWDLIRQADLFILPSFTENFGIAVAEALACGIPVITTTGTPWEDLAKYRCGWWVEGDVHSLTRALLEAHSLSPEALKDMGDNGRQLIETKYSWPRVVDQMTWFYRWILGEAERPNFVL